MEPMRPLAARRWLVWSSRVAAALFVVLAATGVWLAFRYEPAGVFLGSDAEPIAGATSHVDPVRTLHRLAAFAIVPSVLVAVGAAIATIVPWARTRRVVGVTALAIATLGTTLLAAIGGHRIAFGQVGLWRVTLGERPRGFLPLFGSDVRFVFVGATRYPVEEFEHLVVAHAAVLPLVLVLFAVLLGVAVRGGRRPG